MNILFIKEGEEYLHDILFCLKSVEDQTLVIIGDNPGMLPIRRLLSSFHKIQKPQLVASIKPQNQKQTSKWHNHVLSQNRSIQTTLKHRSQRC